MSNRTTPTKITKLKKNEIFVFGSNAEGKHTGGAAKLAKEKFGAKTGVARGLKGQSYAIDTMSGFEVIKEQIQPFIETAKVFPKKIFLVTEIGCGIAGFTPEQIAPLFINAKDIDNIHLPESFWKILNAKKIIRGYKVFNSDFTCKNHKYEIGKEYKMDGEIEICSRGFHFCQQAAHCFSYYLFDSNNIVCEVEAYGDVLTHSEDSKICTNHIKIIRQLTWQEVLVVSNQGKDNTGHSNSGNRNSGDWNSGYWNSGDRNSGDRNSGYWNSGDWNSGDWNSGDRNSGDRNSGNWNSGNWNSGNRNSGDSNSGYRNSGAFCLDKKPMLYLFDKPTKMNVIEWENSEAVSVMNNLDPTIWIPMSLMNDEEKKQNPKYETTEGYLKTIPMKEAWSNLWNNLSDSKKKVFTSLENFDSEKFEIITGIKI